MGSALRCQYAQGDDVAGHTVQTQKKDREKSRRKKPRRKVGFQEGQVLLLNKKINLRISRGEAFKLKKQTKFRVLNVDKDARGKTVLSVHILEPSYPVEEVELSHIYHKFLEVIEEADSDDRKSGRFSSVISFIEKERTGWYRVKREYSGLPSRIGKGDFIRITKTRHDADEKPEGLIEEISDDTWVKLSKHLEFIVDLDFTEEDVGARIVSHKMDESTEDNLWGLAANFPSLHKEKQTVWVVTRVTEGEQADRLGFPVDSWKIVAVDEFTTALNEDKCEEILKKGQSCMIYFDTEGADPKAPKSILKKKDQNNLLSPSNSEPVDIEEKSFPVNGKKKIVNLMPRRQNGYIHYGLACIAFCLIGLLITVLVILDAYSFSHLDRHDGCSEIPIVILIWTILIFAIFFTAIPAGCNGEMNSTCLIGCTEWYAFGNICSVLASIVGLVFFFTLSDSCRSSLKEHNSTWLAYQIFTWGQVGMAALCLCTLYPIYLARSEPTSSEGMVEMTDILLDDSENPAGVALTVTPAQPESSLGDAAG